MKLYNIFLINNDYAFKYFDYLPLIHSVFHCQKKPRILYDFDECHTVLTFFLLIVILELC